jgi:hypothetical protein
LGIRLTRIQQQTLRKYLTNYNPLSIIAIYSKNERQDILRM